jgi:diguanylate cyclase (GGDEF)-like protein/PAS domain S-box-containing protein
MNIDFMLGIMVSTLVWIVGVSNLYKRWQKHKEDLTISHNRFVHVVENTTDFIYFAQVYPEIKYKYLSPSAENFFGEGSIASAYKSADVAFRDVHPDDYDILIKKVNGEVDYKKGIVQRWKDKDGKYRWFEEYASPIYENGKLVALQGVLRNIDERIELQEKLEYRINHDNLTDLYNREYFQLKFDMYNDQINAPVALILCDLDELKYINDNCGHKEGDSLISLTARILNQFSSDKVTVARIGGDEFVLILADTTEQESELLLNGIIRKIERHNEIVANLKVKMSIGFAITNNSMGNLEELFSQADKNMYENKVQRKGLKICN